jgi:hypothetical protein
MTGPAGDDSVPFDFVVQINPRVRVMLDHQKNRAWHIQKLRGDTWHGDGIIRSAAMLRWLLASQCDPAALAILEALPKLSHLREKVEVEVDEVEITAKMQHALTRQAAADRRAALKSEREAKREARQAAVVKRTAADRQAATKARRAARRAGRAAIAKQAAEERRAADQARKEQKRAAVAATFLTWRAAQKETPREVPAA